MVADHITHGGFALASGVRQLYLQGQTDYSLEPVLLVDQAGVPLGRVQDGDAVVFCCRRGEREIQLTEAFTDPGLSAFSRQSFNNLPFIILTLYHEKFKNLPVAFAPTRLEGTVGEVVSNAGMRQLRIAESEKFAHVTFFFNGGNNQPFPGEVDVRIPSPKGLPFDQVPELSLPQVSAQVVHGLEEGYHLIVANFANGDVIGHTSNDSAKIKCAELIDWHLGVVVESALANAYLLFITADHGNLEEMLTPSGEHHVSHTSNPVPFMIVDGDVPGSLQPHDGTLASIAPMLLSTLGLPVPDVMDALSLQVVPEWGRPRKVLLLILDGWGIGKLDPANPIHLAHTPVWDDLLKRYPHTQLQASGEAVGLQPGKAGNSEAGHMNIGAGRCILQDDVRLDRAMQDGSFYTNEILCHALDGVRQRQTSLHLLGLLTEKSSHGSIEYPLALLRMAKDHHLEKVYLHLILDGRSTQPGSAPAMLEKLESQVTEIGLGQIVTAVGRGIALDRDGNYAKTRRAYDALVFGLGTKAPTL